MTWSADKCHGQFFAKRLGVPFSRGDPRLLGQLKQLRENMCVPHAPFTPYRHENMCVPPAPFTPSPSLTPDGCHAAICTRLKTKGRFDWVYATCGCETSVGGWTQVMLNKFLEMFWKVMHHDFAVKQEDTEADVL